MSDIDQIIANGAKTNANFDFGKINQSYWQGRDEFYKQEARDVFRGGVPTDDNGQPDFGAISKTFFQKGDISNGLAAAKMDLERQNLKFGQGQSQSISNFENGGQPNLPPSPNRSASVPVAPPLNRGGTNPQGAPPQNSPQGMPQGAPQGDQPGSIVGLVSSAGIPDELAGPVIAQVSAMTKTDPNAALNPSLAPRVQQVVQAAAQRLRGGQPQQPTGLTPQAAPPQSPPQSPPQAQPQGMPAPVTDRVTTSAPPSQPSQADKAIAFYSGIMSNPNSPKQNVELAKERLKALQSSVELTPTQKEFAQAKLEGFKGTFEDWQNRADENTTERDILTKSLLPRIDKSQETATAARDDISAIHRSREELDQNGGVFSGAFADKKLYLAKVAEALGVPDSGAIKNTEAYGAAIGSRVASMVKAFGSGTAISDGDRKFAAAMAGGNITLDEKSMRRILDIGEKAARGKIDQHNTLADKIVGANKALKDARDTYIVEQPGQYKKPEIAAKPTAGASIASKADYDKLPVGSIFTGPDGKQWRKQ